MRKFFYSIAVFAFSQASASAVVAQETAVGQCIKHGSALARANFAAVAADCRKHFFPASADADFSAYTAAGSAVVSHALACKRKFGGETSLELVNDNSCRVFYYPTLAGGRVTILIPKQEQGGLY